MDFNLPQNLEYCRAYVEQFSGLLLYSHVPTAVVAVFIGLFVYTKSRGSLLAKLFLGISTSFALWCVADFFIWKGYYSASMVMSFWAPIEIFSVALFLLSFYFVYVFVRQKDLPIWLKALFSIIFLSVVAISPTAYNLVEYDLQECVAVENHYYVQYFIGVKLVLALVTLFYLVHNLYFSKTNRRQTSLLGLGIVFFLFSFFVSGYIADLTGDYRIEMYGLFGMMVFIGTLAYLIVTFHVFHIKLLGAQALVLTLISLIGAQFFFIQNPTNRVLNSVTFVASIIFGYFLVRSVKKEVELREALQVANEGQANLLHIINHQIKGYMTKARLVFDDLLSDASYNLSESAKPMIKTGFDSVTEGVNFVQDFLNASNIERGTYTYNMVVVDFKKLVEESFGKLRTQAEAKKLEFSLEILEGTYNLTGDSAQIGQAVGNLIDNSIRYTPTGNIKVQLSMTNGQKILLKVSDTGVGLSDEVKPKLFTKGGRDKDSQKININSTGFGLAFVKGVVEAHKGRVWAESAGVGKGSNFYMELPSNS